MLDLDMMLEAVDTAVIEFQTAALQDCTPRSCEHLKTLVQNANGVMAELQYTLEELEVSTGIKETGNWVYFIPNNGNMQQINADTLDWNRLIDCGYEVQCEEVLNRLTIVDREMDEIGVVHTDFCKYVDLSNAREELVGWVILDNKKISWTKIK